MTLERGIKDVMSLPLAVPGEVILASRLAGWPSTPVCHQTWKSPPLILDYCIFNEQTQHSALHLILKWVINTKCCTTVAQKTCFFLSPGENEFDMETQLQ